MQQKITVMKILFAMLLLLPLFTMAQPLTQTKTYYVLHKAGLSIREKPDVKAKVLDRIPYGTKINLTSNSDTPDTVTVTTDGMTGYFRKATYNGKTGYLIDCYLADQPAPKATVKNLKEYLAQLSPKFGAELVVKSGGMTHISEGGYEQKKQLYKNGGEYQSFSSWEYFSETCVIPGLTVQQAYLLLRLMPDFKKVVTEKEEFPTASKTWTKDGIDFDVKVQKMPQITLTAYGIEKIRIEYSEGAYNFIEIYRHENDVIIYWGSGV